MKSTCTETSLERYTHSRDTQNTNFPFHMHVHMISAKLFRICICHLIQGSLPNAKTSNRKIKFYFMVKYYTKIQMFHVLRTTYIHTICDMRTL